MGRRILWAANSDVGWPSISARLQSRRISEVSPLPTPCRHSCPSDPDLFYPLDLACSGLRSTSHPLLPTCLSFLSLHLHCCSCVWRRPLPSSAPGLAPLPTIVVSAYAQLRLLQFVLLRLRIARTPARMKSMHPMLAAATPAEASPSWRRCQGPYLCPPLSIRGNPRPAYPERTTTVSRCHSSSWRCRLVCSWRPRFRI